MIRLPNALAAWATPAFAESFKQEVEQLDARLLPLQQGLSLSSQVADSPFSVWVINATDDPQCIRVKAGVLFAGIIAGCSCADDPTPIGEQTEFCELLFVINKLTAEASAVLTNE